MHTYGKRILSLLMSVFCLLGVCLTLPAPAQAYSTPAEAQSAADKYYRAYSDGRLNAMNGGEVSEQALLESAIGFLEAAPDPKDISVWGAKTVFKFLLPSDDPNAEVLAKMSEMMQRQDELMNELNALTNVVVSEGVAQQINDYLKADARGLIKTYYGALRQIDTDCSNNVITSDAAAQRRKNDLTRTIPKATGSSGALCEFDEFTYSLGSFLTMDYVTSGLSVPQAKLFTLFDEWQKRNYRWEHQGYEPRAFFQNCALTQYLTAASIDKLSLTARLQELDPADRGILEQRLKDLNEQIKLVKDTLAPMAVTQRPDSERYYQTPGHETLFYTQAAQQIIPDEPSDACLEPYPKGTWTIKGFHYEGLIAKTGLTINLKFWKPLIKYNPNQNTSLPSANLLRTLQSDYGGASLFNIFFDPNAGNFTPPAGAADSWAFVLDQNNGSLMRYEANLFTANHMYISTMDVNGGAQDTNVMNYHNYSVDKDDVRTDLLGIGVKSTVVPAVAASASNSAPSSSVFPGVSYSVSAGNNTESPFSGVFTVEDCKVESFTGAKLNGRLLIKGADYLLESVPGGGLRLRLSDKLLASLAAGSHLLHIYFTDGSGEISFESAASSSVSPMPDVPATGGAPQLITPLMFAAIAVCVYLLRKRLSRTEI